MPSDPPAVLLLGGTAEAAILAKRFHVKHRGRLVLSLAGRTRAPDLLEGVETRIGGFGGAAGLVSFLKREKFTRILDATHPFAVGMSRNAAEAATQAGVPRLALWRPPWEPVPGDRWVRVSCLGAARDALPAGSRPFLALGAQHIAPFRHRPDLAIALRMVDAPEALPFPARVILGKPGSREAEADLFRNLGITHLLCRNSGGTRSYAKIAAARELRLPVVLIDRPPAPPGPLAASVDEALAWLAG
ncbi:cobalt-precorrin-6A reductase [Aureimonas sp. ME7]|uniref:cobalt-precorrin-6A reductase n=1 Tax=Aureimonas sp. ME7 TaxID=2744252 RepID=UPI0015F4E8B1|nr:cobalt-precorrin-6A reductase [Aureimonas sp. ME7]